MASMVGTELDDSLVGTGDGDLLQGLGGSDDLSGDGGNDRLEGGAGDDSLDGGAGDDLVYGGEGEDDLRTGSEGDDQLYGGAGDDLIVSQWDQGGGTQLLDGGAGADGIYVDGADAITVTFVDAGADDDTVELARAATVATGTGSDLVRLIGYFDVDAGAPVRITDFTAGAGGDAVDLVDVLVNWTNWGGSSNPFTTGHLSLEQHGGAALVRVDLDGGGDDAVTVAVLEHTLVDALTAANLAGVSPDGEEAPGVVLDGTLLDDMLDGGLGADTLSGLDGADVLNGGAGSDHLFGGAGDDILDGGVGDDVQRGGDGDDVLEVGQWGADELYGENGDDYLTVYRIGGGDLLLDGGEGHDTFRVWSELGEVAVMAGAGDDRVNLITGAVISTGEGSDVIDFSRIFAGDHRFEVGDFAGGSGGDRLTVREFADQQTAWDGLSNPFVSGHLRLVQSDADTWFQARLADGGGAWTTVGVLRNTDRHTLVVDNLGFDAGRRLTGDSGANVLNGGGASDTLIGEAGADSLDGRGGDDLLSGGDGADELIGDAGADQIYGGEGGDSLNGGDDNDELTGGGGDDTLNGGAGSDQLDGGLGRDTVDYSSVTQALTVVLQGTTARKVAFAGVLTDETVRNVENVIGGTAADRITGDGLANRLEGRGGADRLVGAGGADALLGGDGDDVLTGGAGKDELWGGAGADVYDYNFIAESRVGQATRDVIRGWDSADVLDFRDLDANSSRAGNQDFRWLGQGSADNTVGQGQAKYYHLGGNTYVVANQTADTTADFEIFIAGVHELTSADILGVFVV